MRVERALEPFALAIPAAALGAAASWATYAYGPTTVLAATAAIVGAAVAAYRPIWGVALAIGLIPLELFAVSIGGEAGVSASEAMFAFSGFAWAARRVAAGALPWVASPLTLPLALILAAVVPGFAFATDTFALVKILLIWTAFFLTFQMIVAEADSRAIGVLLAVLALVGGVVGLTAIGRVIRGRAAAGRHGHTGHRSRCRHLRPPQHAGQLPGDRPPGSAGGGREGTGRHAVPGGPRVWPDRGGARPDPVEGRPAGAAAAIAFLVLWRPFRRGAIAAAVVVTVLVAVTGVTLIGNSQTIDRVTQRIESIRYSSQGSDPRFALWRGIPGVVLDHPVFGVGAGQFALTSQRYRLREPSSHQPFEHAHNVVLTIAVELGLVGLAGLVWFVLALAKTLVAACRNGRGPPQAYAFAVAAAFVAIGCQGIVDYTMRSNVIGALVMALAAAAVVLSRPTSPVGLRETGDG